MALLQLIAEILNRHFKDPRFIYLAHDAESDMWEIQAPTDLFSGSMFGYAYKFMAYQLDFEDPKLLKDFPGCGLPELTIPNSILTNYPTIFVKWGMVDYIWQMFYTTRLHLSLTRKASDFFVASKLATINMLPGYYTPVSERGVEVYGSFATTVAASSRGVYPAMQAQVLSNLTGLDGLSSILTGVVRQSIEDEQSTF